MERLGVMACVSMFSGLVQLMVTLLMADLGGGAAEGRLFRLAGRIGMPAMCSRSISN